MTRSEQMLKFNRLKLFFQGSFSILSLTMMQCPALISMLQLHEFLG